LLPVRKLISEKLIPLAYEGLTSVGIPKEERERYLSIIEKRNNTRNGAQWIISNFRDLQKSNKTDQSLRLLTRSIYKNQNKNIPVHRWPQVSTDKHIKEETLWVSHIMTTRLLTVKDTDLADLATSIMEWKNVHHMPVENERGKFCGLLTWTHVEKNLASGPSAGRLVKDIMTTNLITTPPDMPIREAIALMKEHKIGCLPIIQEEELIGIITIKDILPYDRD